MLPSKMLQPHSQGLFQADSKQWQNSVDSEVHEEGQGGRPGRPTPVLNPAMPFLRGSVQMLPSPTEACLPGFLQKNP